MILRRLYVYLVSAASLALLATGLSLLAVTLLLFVFHDPTADSSRPALAGFTAMVVVALPVWLLHQWLANRRRTPEERVSALRRLYLYLSGAGLMLGAAPAFGFALGSWLEPSSAASNPQNQLLAAQGGAVAAVLAALWAYHHLLADRDRYSFGETDAAATLRRWYWYGLLAVSLLSWLGAAHDALRAAWLKAAGQPHFGLVTSAGFALAWFLVWAYHAWRASRPPLAADDQRSTLRAVQGFLVLATAVIQAVFGASLILYYGLARALGVPSPAGLSDPVAGLADPAPALVLYGGTWLLMRGRLARDAGEDEAEHQAGIRRLYTNLVALLAMATLAVGAGGVLSTLSEQVLAPVLGVLATGWRDPLSLSLTLLAVGLAVWLFHWRQAPALAERASLSRRLYLYAVLLGSVLGLLIGGIALLYAVLRLAFSQNPRLADPQNLDFGHFTAVVLVAAAVGAYHFAILRRDNAARPRPAPVELEPVTPGKVRVEVRGASEAQVRVALNALPAGASYSILETAPAEEKPA